MSEIDDNVPTDAAEGLEGYEASPAGSLDGYPLDELAIRDERRTAEDVVRRIEQGRFVMDPDFQRGFVWDISKQSRLIESILMRIPLPVFYVAEDAKGRLIVVDGRQRLTSLQRFFNGELKLDLEGRPDLNGMKFSHLDVRLQNRVQDCQLLFYIIDHAVPERARLDIFERVNGGEKLTRQQMRNAIYSGPATVLLREEAESELFREATGGSLKPGNMQDRELVNRFCSFDLLPLKDYRGDMDKWLATSLTLLNQADHETRSAVRERLRRGLRNNLVTFGQHAFRKLPKDGSTRRSLINASLFDVMSTGLARFDEELVSARKTDLIQALRQRLEDQRFQRAITYGPNTPKEVRTRFEIGHGMVEEVLGAH
jgi:hypothetical protein